jgi:antibiotic biosynthesis monooxygenase (ABM) superfamily enzyme
MIRHIVLFKLREFESETLKLEALTEIKKRLEELPQMISVVRRCEIGIDVRKLASSYDYVLTMDFDNMADLNYYSNHPDHQEFIKFNKNFSVAKASVDYEI